MTDPLHGTRDVLAVEVPRDENAHPASFAKEKDEHAFSGECTKRSVGDIAKVSNLRLARGDPTKELGEHRIGARVVRRRRIGRGDGTGRVGHDVPAREARKGRAREGEG